VGSERKFLVTNYEFGDCHEFEVTPNLELLVTFGMSLEGVCRDLLTQFHYKLIPKF
jgi:hypothetical protein